jgi:tetratricopeptide (TPR) repeat protein
LALAARDEKYSPLSALMLLSRAELERDGIERRLALDAAVAASPSLVRARWARLDARASFGDLAGALADAQHLEAGSTGRKIRHEVCRRAASILLRHGFEPEAGQLFQRALRYVPEDIDAMVGLARSLCATGDGLRAIPLLERAVQTSESGGAASGEALVELAKLIATKLNDLPQAVARLRRVPPSDSACPYARALEGRYRYMMGDVIGASLAFAKMREVIELTVIDERAVDELLEAARFERDVMRDPASAERHLAVALRLSPRNATVQELYREVAAVLVVRKQRAQRFAPEADSAGDDPSEPKVEK